jgi:hypothetical protein
MYVILNFFKIPSAVHDLLGGDIQKCALMCFCAASSCEHHKEKYEHDTQRKEEIRMVRHK